MTDQTANLPRRTQQERREEAERRLLEAAADLIATSGIGSITLAAVGERAGYSRGIVGHHFGSKASLMERLIEAVHREFFNACTAAVDPSASPQEQLISLIRTFASLLEDLPPIHRAFLVLWANASTAEVNIRDQMVKSDQVFRSSIADILRAGQDNGDFGSDFDVAGLAAATAGTLRGVAVQKLIDAQALNVADTFAEVERGLAARLWLQTQH